ncbi:MAG: acyl-CoA thioesterase [Proteobacteria bacterium]|nr:acyl-CoA thioesterase [Pseudomonadota bacterium]
MTERELKIIEDSKDYLAEIVGHESMRGRRMSAANILYLMDLAAGNVAIRHCGGNCSTISFDRLELLQPIFHQDYLRFEAHLLEVGRSSMVIKIDGFVKSPTDMLEQHCHSGYSTFVAIKGPGIPNKNIPGLSYDSKLGRINKQLAEERKLNNRGRKTIHDEIEKREKIDCKELVDPGEARHRMLAPEDTLFKMKKFFLPRNLNQSGVVFGGDILRWMDEVAVFTARQFTENFDMVTIAIDNVQFSRPIFSDDIVEMESRVSFVRNHTLDVDVNIKVEKRFQESDGRKESHTAKFTILNYDRGGIKKLIRTGLNMKDASLQARKQYLKGQTLYFWRKNGYQ